MPAEKDILVCQYEIPNSQGTPCSSSSSKRRKFSEPKEHY